MSKKDEVLCHVKSVDNPGVYVFGIGSAVNDGNQGRRDRKVRHDWFYLIVSLDFATMKIFCIVKIKNRTIRKKTQQTS